MARICPDPACAKKYPDSVSFCGECGKITLQEQDPSDIDPRLGERLGEYLVVARVADGAMGRVYEARHHESRDRVAIKVLHPDVSRDAVAVERFKREYETAAEMQHANIVKVIDFGHTPDGLSFMTMEYLEGEELGAALRSGGRIPAGRLIPIFCQLSEGLEYAHSFGFIHRDLKPDNIFLCRTEAGGDTVRILDFGSVKLQMETGPKLTAFGTTLGSPFYMSPEQAMGKQDVDHRTDVFACAAILYECLTGTIAFQAPNVAQILMKIINQNPTLPRQLEAGLPPRIDDVFEKGVRKDKQKRYGAATELAAALCAAYGLEGTVSHWGAASPADVEQALAVAVRPEAKAFGVPSEAPVPPQAAARVSAPVAAVAGAPTVGGGAADRLSQAEPAGVAGSGGKMIGVAVGALALVGVVLALLMR